MLFYASSDVNHRETMPTSVLQWTYIGGNNRMLVFDVHTAVVRMRERIGNRACTVCYVNSQCCRMDHWSLGGHMGLCVAGRVAE